MPLVIHHRDGSTQSVEPQPKDTLLDVLGAAHESVLAPCGGAGTCKRCQVLVRDAQGIGYKLACQTPAEGVLEVMLEDVGSMHVEGAQGVFPESRAIANPESASYGIAVDIGTTTVVFYLVDLTTQAVIGTLGQANPQITFGSDVISRISASSTSQGFTLLCKALRTCIDEALEKLCASTGVDPAHIERMAIAGNTVMEHFAVGIDPTPIGVAPFTPSSLFGENMLLYQESEKPRTAYFAPAVAGYVGGDITAGILATGLADASKYQLLVDIGTNGEMVLGSKDRMICCATAAGPAFEGANIAFGMPAMPGAICCVARSEEGIDIETIDDRPAVGICGSGLLDALATFLELELIDETGRICDKDEIDLEFAHLIGEESCGPVCYLDDEKRVYLTQADIRNVQLAKAAVRAGIETMLGEMNLTCSDIEGVALAGGFGARLNPQSAVRIGMFPPDLESKIEARGNTAGQGAVACLYDEGQDRIARIANDCAYLELSTNASFNAHYIDAMMFDD